MEGICSARSTPGSLLGSQVGSPPLGDQRQEACLDPFCSVEPKPHCPHPPYTPDIPSCLFQPCGS